MQTVCPRTGLRRALNNISLATATLLWSLLSCAVCVRYHTWIQKVQRLAKNRTAMRSALLQRVFCSRLTIILIVFTCLLSINSTSSRGCTQTDCFGRRLLSALPTANYEMMLTDRSPLTCQVCVWRSSKCSIQTHLVGRHVQYGMLAGMLAAKYEVKQSNPCSPTPSALSKQDEAIG